MGCSLTARVRSGFERYWGRLDGGDKNLILGHSKTTDVIHCLLELKRKYPEARFGFSQHAALAQGLSKFAEQGEILISEEIEKMLIEHFEVTCLGMLSIQGMANEILVCRLEGSGIETAEVELKTPLLVKHS